MKTIDENNENINFTDIPISIPTGFTHKTPEHEAKQQIETASIYLTSILNAIGKLRYAADACDNANETFSDIENLAEIGKGLNNFIEHKTLRVIRESADVLNAGIVH